MINKYMLGSYLAIDLKIYFNSFIKSLNGILLVAVSQGAFPHLQVTNFLTIFNIIVHFLSPFFKANLILAI